ncbi:hypothetical protein ACIPEN_00120 [Herbaspirillum chlorophenolicum]|uniref:Uncharacterized protein n=1 Tax=Herbaspirillum chlorophenolicum TaxID=211589 RepID=A0ABW8EVU3_9BURK
MTSARCHVPRLPGAIVERTLAHVPGVACLDTGTDTDVPLARHPMRSSQ